MGGGKQLDRTLQGRREEGGPTQPSTPLRVVKVPYSPTSWSYSALRSKVTSPTAERRVSCLLPRVKAARVRGQTTSRPRWENRAEATYSTGRTE